VLDLTQLPAFLLASTVVVVTPGVDVLLLLRTAIQDGRRAGLRTLLGIHTAAALQVLLAVSGVGVVIAQHPPVLTALRWLGAAYLTYLAVTTGRDLLRRHRHPVPAASGVPTEATGDAPIPEGKAEPTSGGFARGFLCNITNPKMLLFCLAFLPQFVGTATNPVAQLAMLGALFTALALTWELGVVLGAARMAPRLRRPAVATGLDALCTSVFLGMAVLLFTSTA